MPFTALDPTLAAAAPAITLGLPYTSQGETLSSYLTELVEDLGERKDEDDTWLTKRINRGYRHVASMLTTEQMEGSFTLNAVASQPFYLLPPTVAWITFLSVSDTVNYGMTGGRELELIDIHKYRKLDLLSDEPTSWFKTAGLTAAGMLVLWPTPKANRALTVDFRIRPADLVNATDSPILPVELHETIYLATRYRAMRDLKMPDADKAQNDMLVQLRPILSTRAEEKAKSTSRVTPVSSLRGYYRRDR